MGRDGQPADGRFDLLGRGIAGGAHFLFRARRILGRGFVVQTETKGLLGGDLDIAEDRAHRITLAFLGVDLEKHTGAGGGEAHHGLVRLHLDDVLIGFNGIAFLEENFDNGGLGDGLAKLGHQ